MQAKFEAMQANALVFVQYFTNQSRPTYKDRDGEAVERSEASVKFAKDMLQVANRLYKQLVFVENEVVPPAKTEDYPF